MSTSQIFGFLWVHRLELWWVISLAIGSMVMPGPTDSKFYRWFFTFSNGFAANWGRASQPGKNEAVTKAANGS